MDEYDPNDLLYCFKCGAVADRAKWRMSTFESPLTGIELTWWECPRCGLTIPAGKFPEAAVAASPIWGGHHWIKKPTRKQIARVKEIIAAGGIASIW